jgi:hypothetical protein
MEMISRKESLDNFQKIFALLVIGQRRDGKNHF